MYCCICSICFYCYCWQQHSLGDRLCCLPDRGVNDGEGGGVAREESGRVWPFSNCLSAAGFVYKDID